MDMAIGIEPIIILIVVINTIHFYGQNGATTTTTAMWQTSRTCNMQMHFSPNIFVSVEFDSIIMDDFDFHVLRICPNAL